MTDAPWVKIARSLIGTAEVAGTTHNPAIVQMWADIRRRGIKDDETPWCAAFVGACLERAGVVSSRFESARSYLGWGTPVIDPVPGCVAVFTRQGGGHVGFVVGRDAQQRLLILGGNQANAVNIRAFGLARVSGYRWPTGHPLPEDPLAVASAPLTTGEA